MPRLDQPHFKHTRATLARGYPTGQHGHGTFPPPPFPGHGPKQGAGGHYVQLSPLRYCLAGLPVGYQFKNITDADVNNLLLEELIIWTNYEIEVAAYNSAGLGVYSSKVTEWTLQGGGPSSQSQATVRCASYLLGWEDSGNGEAVGVRVMKAEVPGV